MATDDGNKMTTWQKINTVFIIVVFTSLIWAWNANQNRIADIQKARLQSCQRTYESYFQVFGIFFVKNPKGKQKEDQEKFTAIVNKKIAGCAKQTGTTPVDTTTGRK